MKRLMHKLFLSCEEATMLEEKRREEGLAFFQRIRLRMHLKMCEACKSYSRLSEQMERLFEKRFGSEGFLDMEMPEDKKQELLRKFDNRD